MHLRRYQPTDLGAVLQLYRDTIRRVNGQDYSSEQLTAWIGPDTPAVRQQWQTSLLAHQTYVAVVGKVVVGFADMTATGYLDRLFVSADCQGLGIASRLVDALEQAVVVPTYTTAASLTAQPFFKKQGYQVMKQQVVVRNGIELTNFLMAKTPADNG
ncbi:GNAT family N-acetyltransferase [Levilactobacillus enshiensis]|uniref:GNAT family N-acetyltransferase n=1 Tax=Levilactobacillus enshiensis TaxID=2590213 RepID=UPI001179AC44|nr:GNAT family N-acetyltransferase [Levilactobacillus enshiensis]